MALLLNLGNSLGNVLRNTSIRCSTRNISTTPTLQWFNQRLTRATSSKEREKRYLEKDHVPQNYELIYKAPMESYIAWAMHVSTATAFVITSAAIYQYASGQPLLEPQDTTLVMHSKDIYYFTAGFLAINAIMRFVVSMFPLRIYKDQERRYLAVYHSQLPLDVSHHHFSRGEVQPVYYIFSPWNNATYKLGNKSSLVLEDYFKTPSEFFEMCEDDENK